MDVWLLSIESSTFLSLHPNSGGIMGNTHKNFEELMFQAEILRKQKFAIDVFFTASPKGLILLAKTASKFPNTGTKQLKDPNIARWTVKGDLKSVLSPLPERNATLIYD